MGDAWVSKRQARKAARQRVVLALEHPDVIAILLAHEAALAEYKRSRPRRVRNRRGARQ
jgi:hypothetical protein